MNKSSKLRSVRTVAVLCAVVCLFITSISAQQTGTEQVSYIYSLDQNTFSAYDGSKSAIRLFSLHGTELREKGSIPVQEPVTAMIDAPLGYIFATGMSQGGPQSSIKVYRCALDGSAVQLIYERPTERSQVTALVWNDGKLWIDFFESKYFTKLGYLMPGANAGQSWEFREALHIRMGDSFDSLGKTLVVGRAYGDSQGEDGDLLLVEEGKTTLLPSYRGVRSLALFGNPKNPSIAIGDGWHANYGQVAQARLSLLRKRAGEKRYALEVLDRDTNNYSFGRLFAFPLKGKQRIAAVGNSRVEVYTESDGPWGKQNLYTQTISGRPIEAVLIGADERGATFAISDGGLRIARFEG